MLPSWYKTSLIEILLDLQVQLNMRVLIRSWVKRPPTSTSFRKASISPALLQLRRNILGRYNMPYHRSTRRGPFHYPGSTTPPCTLNDLQKDPEHILPDDPELYILEGNVPEDTRKVLKCICFHFLPEIRIYKEMNTMHIQFPKYFQEIPVITINDEDEPVGAPTLRKSRRVWNGRGIQAVLTKSSTGRLVYTRPSEMLNVATEPEKSTTKRSKEKRPPKHSTRGHVKQVRSKRKTHL